MSYIEPKPVQSPSLNESHSSILHGLNGFVRNGYKMFPNRIFVGGMSRETTEVDLIRYFSEYGNVKSAKIITDIITGASKGYGFVTFASEQEALRLQQNTGVVILHNRKLNIGPAIKRNVTPVTTTNGESASPIPNTASTGGINSGNGTEQKLTVPSGLEAALAAQYSLFPNGLDPSSMFYSPMLPYYGVPFNFPYLNPSTQAYQYPY